MASGYVLSCCLKPCQGFRGIHWIVIDCDCDCDCEMYVWSFMARYLDDVCH